MPRVLNVAEKQSVCKEVTKLLNGGHLPAARPGMGQGCQIYDFRCEVRGQPSEMRFTAVAGHLTELEFEHHHKWHSCAPVELFSAPIKRFVQQGRMKDFENTLIREARNADQLILWLDCDREGENIAFEVLNVCRGANPRLTVLRARFSAVIPREINRAMATLGEPNKNESDAVDARQEIDLRIGAAFTRWQTKTLQDYFDFGEFGGEDGKGPLLSYGPCQFPTLGFIVQRHWEIEEFVPEDFWKIEVRHVVNEGSEVKTAKFNWKRGQVFELQAATVLYRMCLDSPEATVVEAGGGEVLKRPPHPLQTVELQKRASRYLRMGAELSIKMAEELYMEGYLSYPRTETDQFPEGFDTRSLIEMQTPHHLWGEYAGRLLNGDIYQHPRGGGHDDHAHPPIHPVKAATVQAMQGWNPDKRRIYELVVRHFLACLSRPAIGEETKVTIDIAGELFTARGLMVLEKVWLDVYTYDNWSGNAAMPTFHEGMTFVPTEMMLSDGRTAPPGHLQEADLLGLMDRHGIGTDATMAQHIEKQIHRRYALKEGTAFRPTPLGEALMMAYVHMGMDNMWKPMLRSAMEKQMKQVAEGRVNKDAFVQEALTSCEQEFRNCLVEQPKMVEAVGLFFAQRPGGVRVGVGGGGGGPLGPPVQDCPRECGGGRLYLKTIATSGNFVISCSNWPNCNKNIWLPACTKEAVVLDTPQSRCTSPACGPGVVRKLELKFNARALPVTHREHAHLVACVCGCDAVYNQLMEFIGGDRGGRGGGAGGAGGGRGAGRGGRGRGRGYAGGARDAGGRNARGRGRGRY